MPIASITESGPRDQIDADHPVPAVLRDPGRHRTDRPETEDDDRSAVGDARVLDGLPGGRQHVREQHETLLGRAVGDLDRRVLRLRNVQVLGLPAGHCAVELGEAEERGAHALLAHLGRLALGLEALLAHEAAAARDLEGDHHAVAG
jgi:hypothetical protein